MTIMVDRTTPAYMIKTAMTQEYKKFEELLKPDQEAVMTVFLPGREIKLRVGGVGSSDAGLVNIFGEDMDGNPIDLMMFYTFIAYMIEAVSAEAPKRFDFLTTGGTEGGNG